jgi:hypothetical protein
MTAAWGSLIWLSSGGLTVISDRGSSACGAAGAKRIFARAGAAHCFR